MKVLGQIVVILGVLVCAFGVLEGIAPGDYYGVRLAGGAIAACGIVIGGWALIWSSGD